MMVFAIVIGNLSTNVDMFAPYVNDSTVVLLGLVLGEISKAINNAISAAK